MRIPTIGKKEWGQIVDKEKIIKHYIQLGISLKENRVHKCIRNNASPFIFVIIVDKKQNIKNLLYVRYISFSCFLPQGNQSKT